MNFFFALFFLTAITTDVFISANTIYTYQTVPIFSEVERLKKNGNFEAGIDLIINYFANNSEILSNDRYNLELNLGILYWNTGKIKESRERYFNAHKLEISNSLVGIYGNYATHILKIIDLYDKAKAARDTRNFSVSKSLFYEAVTLSKNISSKEHEAKCLRQLSLVFWYENDLNMFRLLNTECLSIARHLNLFRDISICLNNLGLFYYNIEDYLSALRLFEDSLAISQKNKYFQSESECLTNLGVLHKDIGNYDIALSCFNKALEIDKKYFGNDYIANDINNIGTINRKLGLITGDDTFFKKSLDFFLQSLLLIETTSDLKNKIRILNNVGTAYSDLNYFDNALKYFMKSLYYSQISNDIESVCIALNNIGIVKLNSGLYKDSLLYFEKAIYYSTKFSSKNILWESYFEMANAYKKQNNLTTSLLNYKYSIALIEQIRSSIQYEDYKSSYFGSDRRIEAYQNIIDLLFLLLQLENRTNYFEQALGYLERSKARTFVDRIEVSKVSIYKDIDPSLISQEKYLNKKISAIFKSLSELSMSLSEKELLKNELTKLENEYDRLRNNIRSHSPSYANIQYPEIVSLNHLRNFVFDDKTIIFSYSLGKEQSYGFSITNKSFNIFQMSPRKEIASKVSKYLACISNLGNLNNSIGRELYREIILPGIIEGYTKLLIIPDDILYYLPFESLLLDESMTCLVSKYSIEYAPSITSFWEILKRDSEKSFSPKKDIIAFSSPEPGFLPKAINSIVKEQMYDTFEEIQNSRTEVLEIMKYFTTNKKTSFQGKRASEYNLKNSKLEDYQILHFATHCIINDSKPLRSSIILSSSEDSNEDGLIQAREVFNLKLCAKLVVLSSCQSALGHLVRGEGIEGLNRSFFYAGASCVLMTLWQTNDEASVFLMDRYYYYLTSGNSIADSLRKAKIEMLSNDKISHPYYWAPFILSGFGDNNILIKRLRISESFKIFTTIFILFLLVSIFLLKVLKVNIYFFSNK
ncbi:MAG: CHAT domain-containing protein [Candidatus Omnitrophica bacterium]|nr:CHAT domain-containing protein [Candidatus Omnitrophota bacterium]